MSDLRAATPWAEAQSCEVCAARRPRGSSSCRHLKNRSHSHTRHSETCFFKMNPVCVLLTCTVWPWLIIIKPLTSAGSLLKYSFFFFISGDWQRSWLLWRQPMKTRRTVIRRYLTKMRRVETSGEFSLSTCAAPPPGKKKKNLYFSKIYKNCTHTCPENTFHFHSFCYFYFKNYVR